MFHLLIFAASVAAGAIAAISGFGIGSVLTPLVSIHTDTKLAIAIVSIPHLVGTFLRFIGSSRFARNQPLSCYYVRRGQRHRRIGWGCYECLCQCSGSHICLWCIACLRWSLRNHRHGGASGTERHMEMDWRFCIRCLRRFGR